MSFKRLDPEDFLISADSITAGAWTGNAPTLTSFNDSATQLAGASGNYYLNVYQTIATSEDAEVQFNIAYSNKDGLGSLLYDPGISGKSPTSTIYGQFQNIVLGDENTDFNFGGTTVTEFYSITVDRARYKGNLLPGTLTLLISGGRGGALSLTDDSLSSTTTTFNEAGRVYQLLSGSAGNVTTNAITNHLGITSTAGYTPSGSYGLFLPDIGTLLLNPKALDLTPASGGVNLGTLRNSNSDDNNPTLLFDRLKGTTAQSFTLNSQENITSDYVFIRARNSEFNYSTNPSFISGSTGAVIFNDFINAPTTYITTVGLYNDSNELLAVAKLSKPLKKDFTKEALIRVKLDF
jgi:hypothetical protein